MQRVVVFVQRIHSSGFSARFDGSDYDCRFFAIAMNTKRFLATLAAHDPADQEEQHHRGNMMQFVSSHARCWWKRKTEAGHVTGSAWIVNSERSHALLLHHRKLDRWVQPGGHLDDTDASPAAAALREAREETGISRLTLASEALFDVDVHRIPARPNGPHRVETEPAHLHYDVRYLIIAADHRVTVSGESLAAQWVPLQDLAQPAQERGIARMAEKSLRLRS